MCRVFGFRLDQGQTITYEPIMSYEDGSMELTHDAKNKKIKNLLREDSGFQLTRDIINFFKCTNREKEVYM